MSEVPDVRIELEARQWLRQQGTGVMIRPSPRHGCCGGQARIPVAERGQPRQPEHYRQINVDGLTIYLSRDLPPAARLHIRLESLLGWKRLFVDGVGLETSASRSTTQGV